MWRKTFLIAGVAALPAFPAAAEEDSTGCGVGTMLFDGKQGIAPQVLAVTTNGILGNQTFGITSGTLGCEQDGVVRSKEEIAKFIDDNMEALAGDMASGGGEALASLADLMGVAEEDRPAFYRSAKEHFARIYADEEVVAGEVMENLNEVLAESPRLSGYTLT
ncbi:hypothetical protein AN478_13070 [Thiohalorhabdus denitrificans]|uniref:DUF3015 domain-containing protein n=1 Tax=Thiohalorhabdus denitrificans TaxID=381306 RepID=A0A0P9EA08_9GAMM|nr:DUF3015 domain-containing protein [Thiohalorhabdus denitrificans]KPV39200.1 hypothetical protein AN478_13070 [Thiohalorhabdus denitrificans]SCX75396.1 Protein of unknown function [Thiohalorhabdus denitrificans]